ncbi:MAG: sialidase family protein [Opitutaceae bacterium]|nr:sialidase family protein [Opitutaceae bacterium]
MALIAFALGVAWTTAHRAPPGEVEAPEDVVPLTSLRATVAGPENVRPRHTASWVSPPGHRRSAHGSALCALPSGDLLAVWYGGTREGAADVALFTARRAAGTDHWTAPRLAVDRISAQDELERSIKKIGNAVVFPDASGTLWMIYVTVSMGGWSGSALNVKTSPDEGRTWTASRRLTLNPFLNLSTLVRNKPIHASDGRIGLPVYHEMALKFPQMLWLTPGPGGGVGDYRMRNLAAETGLIQPTLVALGDDRVLMMLRDRRPDRRMHTAYSEDNGWTWSEAVPSDLPNPDSALDALRLADGRILMVYNHAHRGRENLRIAVSGDGGRRWVAGPVLESAAGREFSYPSLAEDHGGRIHVTYTWQRERIKHVEFNLAWLDRPMTVATTAQE